MATFRQTFHSSMAKEFVNSVYYGRKTLHYFLGKIDKWKEYTGPQIEDKLCTCECEACVNKNGTLISVDPNDPSVAANVQIQYGDTTNPHNDPDHACDNDTSIRDNMLYIHKIAPDDVSIVIPHNKWVYGQTYTQWDNTIDMTNHITRTSDPFYVINSEFNVYKCLNNGNGRPSTVEPKGVTFDVITTEEIEDNGGAGYKYSYIWKYMYSIPVVKRSKFVSSRYIPVQRAVDEAFYTYGSVEGVVVLNEGSGYSSDPKTTATVEPPPDPNGRTAKITLFINNDTGSIQGVYINDRGSGYVDGTHPKISISERVRTGKGKYANNAEAVLIANVLNGEVDSVVIEDSGVDYLADIETTLSVSGDGEGLEVYPVIVDGRIVEAVITNSGTGYTYVTISAQCANNTVNIEPATFRVMIGGSQISTDQGVVEQMAIPGSIYAIVVTNGSYGYNPSSTTVTVEGDGEGCTARAEIDSSGAITRVIVETYGRNYTNAKITFKDPVHDQPGNIPPAEAYAILPPRGGHGYNAVEELYGSTVAIYSNIRDDGELAELGQDFRQYGIVSNLRAIADNKLIQDSHGVIVFDVVMKASTYDSANLKEDSVMKINNVPYRVVSKQDQMFKLQQQSSIFRSINVGDIATFTDDDNGGVKITYEVTEVVKVPHINKYSGELYYINNNSPFKLQQGRTFGMRTYIKV